MQIEQGEEEHKNKIKKYYDYTRRFYRVFWHGETNAIHYGYHDENTTNHESALLKMIEMTASAGNITQRDIVVDLGCGIGGTAFWIASHIGAKVNGITISKEQYKKALRLRKKFKLEEKTEFKTGDYFHTGYEGNYFDVTMGLESLCYGQHNVTELSKELYRITKDGGRLVVTDGFLGRDNADISTQKKVAQFEEGFVLKKMITVAHFKKALFDVGFKDIQYSDWTEQIMPTAERMYDLTQRWKWFIALVTKLKLVPEMILKNNITGQVQLELFKKRALVYGCITARK